MATTATFRSDERFTQDEFRVWCEERPASDIHHYELIRGQIVMEPPAGWMHGSAESGLSERLASHVRTNALGYCFGSSTGYELPSGDTLEPDFSFISTERMAGGPPLSSSTFLRVVPNLVVEILSPSTARRDATEKSDIYAQSGVDEYWLLDAERRLLTIRIRQGDRFGPDVVVTAGRIDSTVLPQLQLELAQIFAAVPSA